MTVFRWTYVSKAALSDEQAEMQVAELVAVSKLRNASLAVTGALIFTGERFSQILEGPETAVRELQNSILRDGRHNSVTTINIDLGPLRIFDDWSLLYSGPSRFFQRIVDDVQLNSETQLHRSTDDLALMFREFSLQHTKGNLSLSNNEHPVNRS